MMDGPLEVAEMWRRFYILLPPFLFISRWIVQFCTIQRLIKRNGGSTPVSSATRGGGAVLGETRRE
jgi:hypothetical protein